MSNLIKFKKNLIFKRVLFLILSAVTFYIIFNFSEQDAEISGSLSRNVTEFIVELISKIKTMDITMQINLIEKLHPIVRKFAHFAIYTIAGFSLMGVMCTFDMKNIFKLLISFGVGVIYAISDEIHQYYIPGRCASMMDVFIDSMGVLTGIFILITLIVFTELIVNWLKK